jgi:hypothetical protein
MDLRKFTTERLEHLIAVNEQKSAQAIYQDSKYELSKARELFQKALDYKLKNA